jgi:hypothetical protein
MQAAFDTDKILVGLARFSRFYSDKVDVFGHKAEYSTSAPVFRRCISGKCLVVKQQVNEFASSFLIRAMPRDSFKKRCQTKRRQTDRYGIEMKEHRPAKSNGNSFGGVLKAKRMSLPQAGVGQTEPFPVSASNHSQQSSPLLHRLISGLFCGPC